MPSEPRLGETWETRDALGRSTRGIVAEISSTKVTLVSLTGARTNVPVSRFPDQWVCVAAPPVTNLKCSRCPDPGLLTFQRGVTPDYVCPKHMPIGTLATFHTSGAAVESSPPPPKSIIQCPKCGNLDPVEDFRHVLVVRGEFVWWTCIPCNSRWGLLSPPDRSEDPGRWYVDAIIELTQALTARDEVTSVELHPSVWSLMMRSPILMHIEIDDRDLKERGNRVGRLHGLHEVGLDLLFTLPEGSVLIQATRAPATSSIPQRPIQRIGGAGNRSRSSAMQEGFERFQRARQEQEVEELVPQICTRDHVCAVEGPCNGFPRTSSSMTVEKILSESPPVSNVLPDLPVSGQLYYERGTGKEVEVVRVESHDDQWSVAFRHVVHTSGSVGSPPLILFLADFKRGYSKNRKADLEASTEPTPDLHMNEEFYSYEHTEYVRVTVVDERRRSAVVYGGSSGRTRNVPFRDFNDPAKYEKIVRRTSYDFLMDDE